MPAHSMVLLYERCESTGAMVSRLGNAKSSRKSNTGVHSSFMLYRNHLSLLMVHLARRCKYKMELLY
jgi:hypothetical protein